ncbi:Uncharacterized protein LOCC1_G007796 [Lachnellula occidentalis]|uniref:Uncharacterized protein n=1 Tax=Lachnellula occidentalis TaxID=215460 RepID=A0A8H8U4D3_9HELO|nr:Uncharacterized protein LOCC1_G007796 [Lachnellula occidentalis]
MASNHPLPAAPGQQQQRPVQQRERAKSTFSFRSHHSKKSNESGGHKVDLHETHQEKDSKRLHTKADPSMALAEAEPSAVANSVQTSLAPIRAIQHRDAQGNPIADPDRNNPTRSRWERPLDTIRAFEAAIDGNYSRKSDNQTEVADTASVYNRRSSYYGGTQVTQNERPQYPQNNYYGRSQSYRPESTYTDRHNGAARPESYYNGENAAGPSNGYHPNRARYPRTASEPQFNNGQGGVYPAPGNQPSYETVTTASGSGGSSGDPAGYSTDPSSENSSMDRVAPLPHKEVETYGFNGFGNTPQYAPPGSALDQRQGPTGAARQGNGYQHQGPPPPSKESAAPRVPIKLGETDGNAAPQPAEIPAPTNEKRKSWFGRKLRK